MGSRGKRQRMESSAQEEEDPQREEQSTLEDMPLLSHPPPRNAHGDSAASGLTNQVSETRLNPLLAGNNSLVHNLFLVPNIGALQGLAAPIPNHHHPALEPYPNVGTHPLLFPPTQNINLPPLPPPRSQIEQPGLYGMNPYLALLSNEEMLARYQLAQAELQRAGIAAANLLLPTSLPQTTAIPPQLLLQNPLVDRSPTVITQNVASLAESPGSVIGRSIEEDANVPMHLPAVLALPEDEHKLSAYQLLLRDQIEAFQAKEEDLLVHIRGRNKPIKRGQVGIRCRHCRDVSHVERKRGSMYFPASVLGIYQAAQNMSSSHFSSGACDSMPESLKQQFRDTQACKSTVGAGKQYWASAARKIGLIDTPDGIRFVRDLTQGPREQGRGGQG